jgi:uncharacterized protein (TIGR02099 family)
MKRLAHYFWMQIWLTGVVALVMLALYTSAGRQLIPLVETYKTDLELLLTEQLEMPVSIASLQGDWAWFSPLILIDNVKLGDGDSALKIQSLKAELDVSASIFYRTPVFKNIDLTGVNLAFKKDPNGLWSLGDFPLISQSESSPDKPLWLELLASQGELRLYGWNISLEIPGEKTRQLSLLDVRLRNQRENHWLDGKIQLGGIDGAVMVLQIESIGDLWDLQQQQADIYMSLPALAWQPWLPELPAPWKIQQLDAGVSLWAEVKDGRLSSVDGYLDLPAVAVTKTESDSARDIKFRDGLMRFVGRADETDWHFWFRPEVEWLSDSAPPLPSGRISWLPGSETSGTASQKTHGFQFHFDDVDLAQTAYWIEDFSLLDDKYQAYLSNLRPRGIAESININWLQGQNNQLGIILDVIDTGIDAWNGIPAAEHINARVELTPKQGRSVVKSQPGFLHFPSIYEQGWQFDRVELTGYWKMFDDYLHIVSPEVHAEFNGSAIHGGFSVYTGLNESEIEPQLHLLLGLVDAPVDFHQHFIPTEAAPGLQQWLSENLHAGQAKQAEFLYAGSIAKDETSNNKTLQLYLDAQDAELTYLPGWPKLEQIKGRVLVDAPQVDIWINKAKTLAGDLVPNSGRIKIHTQNDETLLTVNGQLTGDAAQGIRYLQDTPLRDQLSGAFDSWAAAGAMSAELFVQLPLSESKKATHIRLQTDLQGVDLNVEDLKLNFQQMQGSLVYDSQSGLRSEKLLANTFSGSAQASIESQRIGNEFDINIRAKGNAQLAEIKNWQPLFFMQPVTGAMDYELDFWVRPIERGGLTINIDSDLVGTQIEVPAPFGKAAEQPQDFSLSINKTHELRLGFEYGTLSNGIIAMGEQGVERGQIYLGSARAFVPSGDGIEIKGHIDQHLNAKAWWDLWQKIKPVGDNSQAETQNSILQRIDISMPAVDAWGQQMGTTAVKGQYQWGEWLLDVDSELMKGQVVIGAIDKPIKMDLNYIHFPVTVSEGPEFPFGAIEASDPMQEFDPAWVPALDMKLEELYVGTKNYGRWDLSVRQRAPFTEIRIHDSFSKAMRIRGDVLWSYQQGVHKTQLKGMDLTSKKLGDVQRGFSISPAIEAKDARFAIDMEWLGSPLKFNYASLNGAANVRIREGVLVSDGAGALKAFGVLNFDSISRRLKLDFSDLYESGVVFDIMKTKLVIDDGLLTFTEPMWIDGPSAKFQTSGTVNLVTEEVDQKLIVTFPITSSLPLVAVLAGLTPQVAGAIYVTEKLIGEELEQFTSASYNVSGTISKPEMKIDQAFNNELEGKESKSFTDRILDIFGAGGD